MSRYIDADSFKDTLAGASERMHLICGVKAVDIGAVIKAVDMFPTADVVEVRHGEWIEQYEGCSLVKCSVCDYEFCDRIECGNYCPNCGAKMDRQRRKG